MDKNTLRKLKKRRYQNKIYRKKLKKTHKIKKIDRRYRENQKKKLIDRSKKKKNDLIKFLKAGEFYKKTRVPIDNNRALINIPEVFSFIENPDETIGILKTINYLGTKKGINKIRFNHSRCKEIDLAASAVMDVILMSLKDDKKKKKKKLNLSGELPEGITAVKEMLFVSGILNSLGLTKHIDFPDSIKKLEILQGGLKSEPFKNKHKESGTAATEITEYFDECLRTQGVELQGQGKRLVGLMIGEVIDNCQLHGGEFYQWYAIGHYSMFSDKNCGEFHLSIFNFGQTIYEGLLNGVKDKDLKESLKKMSDKHSKSGFFKFKNWNEESLWTLYSLQDGVSRLRCKETDPDRGTGTIRLINSFQQIGDTYNGKKAKMSITSGYTHIYFDDRYKLDEKSFKGEKAIDNREVIAFNAGNDLSKPPDEKNVRKLKNYFPGTMISMKFYLDRNYLSEKISEL